MFFTVLQSQNVGSGGVLGSGAITVAGPTLVAAGACTAPVIGTGQIAFAEPTLAAAGACTAPVVGTGGIVIGGPVLSAAGACTGGEPSITPSWNLVLRSRLRRSR